MTPERIEQIKRRRDELAQCVEQLNRVPEHERPKKPAALAKWLQDLRNMEDLLAQMNQALAKLQVTTRATAPAEGAAATADEDGAIVIARIPKGPRAEMRVSVKPWKNRRVVDIRLWAYPQGGGEMKPSRKGLAFDAGKLGDLVDALQRAKQYV